MIRKIATKCLLVIELLRSRFITFHTRPIFESGLQYKGKETVDDSYCAIVMQGPIKHEDNFTLESVKLYRRHYPSATIILSTWEGEDVSEFETMVNNHLEIVLSAKPRVRGPHNVNMQIASTKAGIERAVLKGFRHVLKTRTDQRLYGIKTLQFMQNLLKYFPVLNSKEQQERIVSTGSGTSKTWVYHFSDLVMFGNSSDMQKYWSVNLMAEDSAKGFVPEQYLLTNFLKKTGWAVKDTMEDYLAALGKRCVVIDNEAIDVYWPKYASLWREYRLRNYFSPLLEISFKTWVNDCYIPALSKNQ